ncbi:hypothetical protein DPEC_G00190440 [Dallia pectoralis]|uniref:Uncharacterized protein n=1 Tax=Dallia pectoralis TaxID=75939 RepID=A0ACC2GC30_DALPE|nr:hypothetical protein DPEC_G00190440 [Dallia pectoralis]
MNTTIGEQNEHTKFKKELLSAQMQGADLRYLLGALRGRLDVRRLIAAVKTLSDNVGLQLNASAFINRQVLTLAMQRDLDDAREPVTRVSVRNAYQEYSRSKAMAVNNVIPYHSQSSNRRGVKLAAVRELWDEWSARLPSLYNPGPDVTVDEQLVPFRAAPRGQGSRPGWHGAQEQARAAARAARDQDPTGPVVGVRLHAHRHAGVLFGPAKQERAAPEHAARGRPAQRPCGQEARAHPRLQPQQGRCGQPGQGHRHVQLPTDDRALAPGRVPQHPRRVLVQRLRDMARGPPDWMPGKRNKRRVFLERLGKALVRPLIERRVTLPRTEASAVVVRARARRPYAARRPMTGSIRTPWGRAPAPEAPAPDNRASKRKRCQMCPSKKDRKTHTVCGRCNKYICKDCSRAYCTACANWGFVRGGTI